MPRKPTRGYSLPQLLSDNWNANIQRIITRRKKNGFARVEIRTRKNGYCLNPFIAIITADCESEIRPTPIKSSAHKLRAISLLDNVPKKDKAGKEIGYCTARFTGQYPVPFDEETQEND